MKTSFYSFLILFAGLFIFSCSDNETPEEPKTDDGPKDEIAELIWDSSYFYNADKTLAYRVTRKYNKKGLVSYITTSRRSGDKWEGRFVEDYTYDSNDSLTINHLYNADADGNPSAAFEQRKIEYTRDSKGLLLSEAMYLKYPNSNEWVNEDHKCDYTYDASGRMISYIYYDCILPYRTFRESRKFEYTYDGYGNKISGKRYYWDGFEWYVNANYEYSYDAENRLTNHITDYFAGKDRVEYTYNAFGKRATVVFSKYNGSSWVASEKYEYLYNSRGDESSEICYVFKNNTMEKYSKNEYSYDDNGNLIYSAQYIYNNGKWEPNAYRENFFSAKK